MLIAARNSQDFACCARALEICFSLRRTQLRQLQRDFAAYAIYFCLVPPFLCCLHRGHRFANTAPLDKLTRLFNRRLGLRRRIAFDVHESVNECELQLDLFSTQGRRAGQSRNLVKGPTELLSGLGGSAEGKASPLSGTSGRRGWRGASAITQSRTATSTASKPACGSR